MRFPELTRDGVLKWRWQYATRRLRDAYEASRSALDSAMREVEKDDAKRLRAKPDPEDRDEVEAYDAWIDQIVNQHDEIQNALETIKQGFVVILYHSWEKHAVDWTQTTKRYHQGFITKRLKDLGYVIHPGVHKLRKVANTIKHDSDELWREDRTMFRESLGTFMSNGVLSGYARYLEIPDEQMDAFFDALLASGPPGPATPSL